MIQLSLFPDQIQILDKFGNPLQPGDKVLRELISGKIDKGTVIEVVPYLAVQWKDYRSDYPPHLLTKA